MRGIRDLPPGRVTPSYRRFRHAPWVFKVDFAVDGGVPWRDQEARRAGTAHRGGAFTEIAEAEPPHPRRPHARASVRAGGPAVPGRSRPFVGDIHTVRTYAHVPHGYRGGATESIVARIEHLAPGFHDRVIGMAVRTTAEIARYDKNNVGGDILAGDKDVRQLVFGPRIGAHPYDAGAPGMCGFHAAHRHWLINGRRGRRAELHRGPPRLGCALDLLTATLLIRCDRHAFPRRWRSALSGRTRRRASGAGVADRDHSIPAPPGSRTLGRRGRT